MREPFVFIRSLFGLRAGLNLSIKALEQRLTSRTNLLRILVHENGIESANTLFFLSGSVRLSRLKMAKRKVLYFRKRKHKIVKKKGKIAFFKTPRGYYYFDFFVYSSDKSVFRQG